MIYWAQIKHSRRTYQPEFIMPETHDPRKHPVFKARALKLPEEQFYWNTEIKLCDWPIEHPVELFPTWLRFETPEKEVQDFYNVFSWLIVSEKVKKKISELEPNIHQFIPVKLLQKDGTEPWGQYYFFHIRQNMFSIDEAKSPYFKWQTDLSPGARIISTRLECDPKAETGVKYDFANIHLVYRSVVVGNRMIWRERLDLDTQPNSGKLSWQLIPGEEKRGLILLPTGSVSVEEMRTFRIQRDFGFRMTSNFKRWIDGANVKGLDCSRFPGVLDIEWNGQVK